MFKREGFAIALVGAILVVVIAIFGLVQAGVKVGEKRHAEAVKPIIDNLDRKLKTCEASVANLTGSLELQNDQVDLLRSESMERAQRAAAAIKRAENQARTTQAKIERLERSKPTGDLCASARIMIAQSLGEDRP